MTGLTEQSEPRLLDVQKQVREGLQGQNETKGTYVTFEEIGAMTGEQKAELTSKGIILARDRHYKTVVPRLDDSQRGVLHNDRFAVMMNYPYEHFRYIVNWPGASVRKAIELMQKGVECSKANGARYCMLATKSYLCSNLGNLGAFQIRLTLNYCMPWD